MITKTFCMARGDKNKRGTSGRAGSNNNLDNEMDMDISRAKNLTRSFNSNERRFNLLVDSVPYMIKATPFRFNGEIRYRVSLNGGADHVFTWDSSVGQLRAIDDDASTLPDNLEEAISDKLQSKA